MASPPPENLLRHESSPYLLQHADNPVHWRPWGRASLAEAKQRDVPILLSVGYAACHWCHVMAHESFEDAGTAAVMNELFVNVKVDREERPDLDQIYQAALAMLGEQGGWPLTMFLTPAGEPFWGGTYFPPTARYGRAAFTDVLRGIAATWTGKRVAVAKNVQALMKGLAARARSEAGGEPPLALIDNIAQRLAQEVDPVQGGIGGAPKFPNTPIFEQLWRAHVRSGDGALGHAVTLTLDRMSQGGIYDHLGGGYARYSTDAVWLAPHFEKMLYDNAQLVDLLALVWPETKSELHAARVAETIGWLEREMLAEDGAFAATLDADSEGEEGKFYVWTEAEIDAVLGPDAAAFKRIYDVRADGNWEGHTILNRSRTMLLGSPEQETALASSRAKLLARRAGRVRPARDDKILADWNGLMIAALARAGFVFDRPEWIALARRAFDAVERLLTGPDGRLRHSYRAGKLGPLAMLDDHAALARAGVALHEATGDPAPLARAAVHADEAHRLFWDDAGGGHFFAAADADDLVARPKHAHDNATPAGNGVLAQALARLFLLTGEARFRDRAEGTVAAFSGELERNFFPLSTLLGAAELLQAAKQLVIVGAPEADDTRALLRAAATSSSQPNLVLQRIAPGAELPAAHPARGKGMSEGRATAYLCRGPVCSAPLAEPAALAKQLSAR